MDKNQHKHKVNGGGLLGAGDNEHEEENDEEEEYESSRNVEIREKDFSFQEFVNRFVTPKAVEACVMLLSGFEKNSVNTNHCVIKLLHRICWDCKVPAMVFQATLFRVFQRVFESRHPEHKELQKFAKFIIQKFVEVTEKNPKVYMELLFWKRAKDAVEIVDGYGSYKSQAASKVNWTEEQEDELRRLHDEFHRDNPGPNVVEWVMQNIINKDRPQRSVVKKMKDLGLLSKTYSLIKSTREWTDAEESQLRELVPKFIDAEKPIECILLHFEGSRSKRSVVKKCLEMGLISDKKELYKKKSGSRPRNRKKNGEDESDGDNRNTSNSEDDTDHSDSGESDISDRPSGQTNGKDKPKSKNKTVGKRKSQSKNKNLFEVNDALKACVNEGFQDALEWLSSSLLEAIEDVDDENVDVPILAISESCMQAMEETTFLDMLEKLGIKKPENEQEKFWRIPGIWKETELKEAADMIRKALDGTLSTQDRGTHDEDNNSDEETSSVRQRRSEDDESDRRSSRSSSLDRTEDLPKNHSNKSDSEDDNVSTQFGLNSSIISNPESSDEETFTKNSVRSKQKSSSNNTQRKRLLLAMSSDSEEEANRENVERNIEKQRNDFKDTSNINITDDADNNDTINKPKNRKNIFDSDSENESGSEKENISRKTSEIPDGTEYDSDASTEFPKRKRTISSDSSGNSDNERQKKISDISNTEVKSPILSRISQSSKRKKRISNSDSDDQIDLTTEISFSNRSEIIQSNSMDENSKDSESSQPSRKPIKRKAVIHSSSDED